MSDRARWGVLAGVAVDAVIVVTVVLFVKEPAGRRSGQTRVMQPGET